MTLMPCNTCRLKETCELRAEKRRMLRGSKLTSARFDCQLRRDDMPPGAVVDAKLKYVWTGGYTYSPDEGGLPDIGPAVLRGIVMRWYRGKVLVYFPEQDAGSLWSHKRNDDGSHAPSMAKLSPACLTPTGESAQICKHCDLPENAAAPRWVCRRAGQWQDGDPLPCEYELAAVRP